MSMPASLLSFVIFKSASRLLSFPFQEKENGVWLPIPPIRRYFPSEPVPNHISRLVFVQTVAVAVGCMSLSAGLVGVVPAIEKLLVPSEQGPIILSTWSLIVWSLGLAFFGVIFSVPLRKQVIIREKLRFPSGTATATMIKILHKGQADMRTDDHPSARLSIPADEEQQNEADCSALRSGSTYDWQLQTRILSVAFGVSALYVCETLRELL
ncbi:hypothetical protein ABW19_dt0205888 [Dactylella cylindrospora]|nr:hypothetical protein ABW19_dt0205888 [Dactylella cylindrospora]